MTNIYKFRYAPLRFKDGCIANFTQALDNYNVMELLDHKVYNDITITLFPSINPEQSDTPVVEKPEELVIRLTMDINGRSYNCDTTEWGLSAMSIFDEFDSPTPSAYTKYFIRTKMHELFSLYIKKTTGNWLT